MPDPVVDPVEPAEPVDDCDEGGTLVGVMPSVTGDVVVGLVVVGAEVVGSGWLVVVGICPLGGPVSAVVPKNSTVSCAVLSGSTTATSTTN